MNDEQTIRGELDRLAAGDPLGPIDSARLLDRGRRGRRRHRILASGTAVAAVSAVIVTAAVLPGLRNATKGTDHPTVAATSSSEVTSAATEVIGERETLRRCRQQWEKDSGKQIPDDVIVLSGQPYEHETLARYQVHSTVVVGQPRQRVSYTCSIPAKGENRPGRVVTAPAMPPVSAIQVEPDADDATVLQACSAKLLRIKLGSQPERPGGFAPEVTDLTGWRIAARMNLPKVGTTFVAVSPAGDRSAVCDLYAPTVPTGYGDSSTTGVSRVTAPAGSLGVHYFEAGAACDEQSMKCTGFMYVEAGRVTPKVARFHLVAKNGHTVDVPVHDGWYAIMWADGVPLTTSFARWTAYDANGNVVRPGG